MGDITVIGRAPNWEHLKMAEHCVCAHCKLAAAEQEIARLKGLWSWNYYAEDRAASLRAAVAEYEVTVGMNPLDSEQAERMSDARVDLFFAAKGILNQLPPPRTDPSSGG